MENDETYFSELAVAVAERSAKRWFISFLVMLIIYAITVGGFIVYENSFEDVVVTQENEDGYNNFIGNDGDINYGETDDKQFDFLDSLAVLSFLIALQNLDLNTTQTDIQSQTETLDKSLRSQVEEIHAHLEQQDKLLNDLLLELQERST